MDVSLFYSLLSVQKNPMFYIMPEPRQSGPTRLISDEPVISRLNLKIPISSRDKLEKRARDTGISPTETIKRWIDGAPDVVEEIADIHQELSDLREMVSQIALQSSTPKTDGIEEQFAETARELGFLDPAHLIRALAGKAVENPSAIKSLLFDELKSDVKTRAKAELAARTNKKVS